MGEASPETSGQRFVRWSLSLTWIVAALFVVSSSVEESPLPRAQGSRAGLAMLLPQGWAFFTRDPREPFERIYRLENRRWTLFSVRNSSAGNGFGFRRSARVTNIELVDLLRQLKQDAWRECRGSLQFCVSELALKPIPVEDRALVRHLCGDLLIERKPPVPWAWARSPRPVYVPATYARLSVSCDSSR